MANISTSVSSSNVLGRRRRRTDPDSLYTRNAKLYVDQRDGQQKLDYQPPTITQNVSDEVVEVFPEESWRPDLLASRVYNGRHFLARVIMRANDLFHVSELQAGMKVKIPELARIQGTIV